MSLIDTHHFDKDSVMMSHPKSFWCIEDANEVVAWVVVAALALAMAGMLFGNLEEVLNNGISFIVDQLP